MEPSGTSLTSGQMNSPGKVKVHLSVQTGTNKFASQSGMTCFGASRNVWDTRAGDMSRESQAVLTMQTGTNKHASQSGMSSFGATRKISDIRADDLSRESQGQLPLLHHNKDLASQRGR